MSPARRMGPARKAGKARAAAGARQPSKGTPGKPAKGAKPAAKAKAPPRQDAIPKFGRTGTAGKGEGDAAVAAWIEGIRPEHQAIAKRFDALAGEAVPGVKRAVKWSAPFYGVPGKGWIATVGSFKEYVAIRFFSGAKLSPPPPLGGSGSMRSVQVRDEAGFDEARLRAWVKQASSIQGWGKV